MAYTKIIVAVIALCAIFSVAFAQISQGGSQASQGGPHQNQGRIRRQASQAPAQDSAQTDEYPVWITCNFTADSVVSCHDCNTRLICKPIGGLLKECRNPYRPYCNNGLCSPVPSAECA